MHLLGEFVNSELWFHVPVVYRQFVIREHEFNLPMLPQTTFRLILSQIDWKLNSNLREKYKLSIYIENWLNFQPEAI